MLGLQEGHHRITHASAGMNGHAGGQSRRLKKDAPHEMDLQCSLEELYRGTTRRMKIRCALHAVM